MTRTLVKRAALPAALMLSGWTLQCGSAPPTAGNTSGGEARTIVGRAMTGTAPAAHAAVRLRPADYVTPLPGSLIKGLRFAADAITDDSGRFTIDSVDTGRYFLEINDLRSNAALLPCTLEAGAGPKQLAKLPLGAYASIRGSIDYAGKTPGTVFLQIYGLERLMSVDSSGEFALNDLPAGAYTLRLASADSSSLKPATIPGVITEFGSLTMVAPFAAWRFSRRLTINTSASGATVTEDITAFPLLVRIDDSNFDFSQARDSGEDVRLEKADGTPLAHEIELWDLPSRRAAVWVRMDTIYGNNSVQSITMRWGNPNAAGLSDARAVFDTADGFIGVWHLGEPGTSVRRNSAQTAFGARPGGYSGNESAPGIIGRCDDLDSMAHDTLGIINTDLISVSAWVNPRQLQSFARIVSRPDTGVPFYHTFALLLDSTASHIDGAVSAGQWPVTAQSTSTPGAGSWTHLCLIFDGTRAVLYVNGIVEGSATSTAILHRNALTAFIAWQPSYPGHQKLIGKIDEVRIEGAPRSAAWVKLSYENQKAGSGVVVMQ